MTTGQFVLSGLGDEIDPDVAIQLEVMNGEGLDHLEFRGMENTNVLDLSAEQIARAERVLDEYGFEVSAIASPIGKVDVTEPFEPHFERFERALALADEFDAEYVRIFSYYYPEDDDPGDWRDEILERMARKAERAEENGVTLIHENERDIYGDTPERCRDIIETVDSPNLRALFDPANFVVDGIEVYPTAYDELADYVEYVHVKDARFTDDIEIEPAGEGDADVREVSRLLMRTVTMDSSHWNPTSHTPARRGGSAVPKRSGLRFGHSKMSLPRRTSRPSDPVTIGRPAR